VLLLYEEAYWDIGDEILFTSLMIMNSEMIRYVIIKIEFVFEILWNIWDMVYEFVIFKFILFLILIVIIISSDIKIVSIGLFFSIILLGAILAI